MKNLNANCVQPLPPYTLDSLLVNLQSLPDGILQHYLEDCVKELKELTEKDASACELTRISNDLIELDLPLVGCTPWDIFVENVQWSEPYYKWIQCLASGKNSNDCILPEAFLNWRDKIKPEQSHSKPTPNASQAIDISKPGQIFNADILKMLMRNQRNYRRYLGTWNQEMEALYHQVQ